jgi:peptidoglycan LD-endopeptidase LytH
MQKRPITYLLTTLLLAGIITGIVSCGGVQPLKEVIRKQTPHERYAHSLEKANLENTALGQAWLAASQRALRDSLYVTLPFKESGYFAADNPIAASYRVNARRGERLVVQVETRSPETAQVFIDVFTIDDLAKPILSADTTGEPLEFEVKKERTHLIRVQPELLRGTNYTVTITSQPTLAFPVQGGNNKSIGSFWGADRDGGRRRHEGIDIFAKKGTPAIAATEGYVRRVNETNLGGKVVWLWDTKRNQSLYYAHLDTQMVRPGQRVMPGDTLGLVGNTGNARYTPPHLHFGIYQSGEGAIDPLASVWMNSQEAPPVTADMQKLNQWARVAAKKLMLRTGPDTKSAALGELGHHSVVKVVGGVGNWYRLLLPNGRSGYASASYIETLDKAVRTEQLPADTGLLDAPDLQAAQIDSILSRTRISVLGQADNFLYVQTESGQRGWVATPPVVKKG